jgi:hypothetical protein
MWISSFFWYFLAVLDGLIVHKLFKDDAGDPSWIPSGCDPSLTVTKEGVLIEVRFKNSLENDGGLLKD